MTSGNRDIDVGAVSYVHVLGYTWWTILLGTYSNWNITFFVWDLGPVDLFFFSLFGDIIFHPDFGFPT